MAKLTNRRLLAAFNTLRQSAAEAAAVRHAVAFWTGHAVAAAFLALRLETRHGRKS